MGKTSQRKIPNKIKSTILQTSRLQSHYPRKRKILTILRSSFCLIHYSLTRWPLARKIFSPSHPISSYSLNIDQTHPYHSLFYTSTSSLAYCSFTLHLTLIISNQFISIYPLHMTIFIKLIKTTINMLKKNKVLINFSSFHSPKELNM